MIDYAGHNGSHEMNKNDISKKVYDAHGGLSYADALKVVDLILETIKKRLSRGEKVLISGFGCFTVFKKKDKKGVNPQTGAPVIIPGRNAIKFRPSKYLKSV
jgi:DNA-binding protein HU-beta